MPLTNKTSRAIKGSKQTKPVVPSDTTEKTYMGDIWWTKKEEDPVRAQIPTMSKLRFYVDDPPDFVEDFFEWCCAREQLWAIKKGFTEKCVSA